MTKFRLGYNMVLIQPDNSTSSFSSEIKKYDRRAIAVVKDADKNVVNADIGDKIVYNDSEAVSFTYKGSEMAIIDDDAIVAVIEEEKE